MCHTRSMKYEQCEDVRAAQAKLADDQSCIYCQREFDSQRGLSLHLSHCKNRQVFNDLPTCSVVVEPLPEAIIVSESESGSVSSSAELFCLPDGCNAEYALASPVNHHSTEFRANSDAEFETISNLPNKLSIKLVFL